MSASAGPAGADDRCPVCDGRALDEVIRIAEAPVFCNRLLPSAAAARAAPKGEIDLVHCRSCSHLFNRRFDPALMGYAEGGYDNSLHFSAVFEDYASGLAERLVARYRLHGKTVMDVGCGGGEFLELLCRHGAGRGIGFEPSQRPGAGARCRDIEIVADYYSERYADRPADFIACRHVLEHVARPATLLAAFARALEPRPRAACYVEVPNALWTIAELGIWDLIYEHVSYFTPASLRAAFEREDFAILDEGASFADQYLWVEASRSPTAPSRAPAQARNGLDDGLAAFARRYQAKTEAWRSRLEADARAGRKTVLWGAGSKGVTFLNVLGGDAVSYVVDVNPNKIGKFVPGSGQEIVAPEFLAEYRPDRVIVMNMVYGEEIAAKLRALSLDATTLPA